jgi:hypothetical protein
MYISLSKTISPSFKSAGQLCKQGCMLGVEMGMRVGRPVYDECAGRVQRVLYSSHAFNDFWAGHALFRYVFVLGTFTQISELARAFFGLPGHVSRLALSLLRPLFPSLCLVCWLASFCDGDLRQFGETEGAASVFRPQIEVVYDYRS